jgi:predicted transcriptional regulator
MKVRKFKIKILARDETPAEAFKKDALREWKLARKGKLPLSEYDLELTFPDISWLSKIFSPERIRLIQAIKEKRPESIYQLAKILGRVHTNVHKDVHDLAEMGIIELKKARRNGQKREALCPEYNWDGFDIAV